MISTTDPPFLFGDLVTFQLAFIPAIVVGLGEETPFSGDVAYKLAIDI
jgi:hypothetical protein